MTRIETIGQLKRLPTNTAARHKSGTYMWWLGATNTPYDALDFGLQLPNGGARVISGLSAQALLDGQIWTCPEISG